MPAFTSFHFKNDRAGLKYEYTIAAILTLSWRRPLSYRNQSIDLPSKWMDWFLYDNGLRHKRVKIWNKYQDEGILRKLWINFDGNSFRQTYFSDQLWISYSKSSCDSIFQLKFIMISNCTLHREQGSDLVLFKSEKKEFKKLFPEAWDDQTTTAMVGNSTFKDVFRWQLSDKKRKSCEIFQRINHRRYEDLHQISTQTWPQQCYSCRHK